MDISELVFAQKYGVFFVWRMNNGKVMTTFLRNRANISPEIQTENAINDGRDRRWTLIGVGHWYLYPLETQDTAGGKHDVEGISLTVYTVTAALLRLKKLRERELQSTTVGIQEMREKWLPHICERLRKILWEGGE